MTPSSNTSPHDAVTLADGIRLRLTPIDCGDCVGVAAMFARLSPESRYRRLLSRKPQLTPRELTFLADVDQVHHVAIAAVDAFEGSIVGISGYVRPQHRAGTAEVSLVVVDELQGMGIGTALANEMVQRACADRLTHLTATTLWENRPARALLRRLGFRVRTSDCHEIQLLLELGCKAQAASPHRKRPQTCFPGN